MRGINKYFIIILIIFTIPSVSSIDISTCTTLASGSNMLTQSLAGAGTCLDTLSHNVELNCQGNNITYGTGSAESYGFDVIGSRRNVTIKNCRFFDGNSSTTIIRSAIRAYASAGQPNSNMTIYNNTIHTIGNNSYGINLMSYNGTNVSWNNITTVGDTSFGIFLNTSSENIIINNHVNASGTANSYGIYLLESRSTNITNNVINVTGGIRPYTIYLANSSNNLIGYNTISLFPKSIGNSSQVDGYVIFLNDSSNNNNITGNNIQNNGSNTRHFGIMIWRSRDNRIEHNVIKTYNNQGNAINMESLSSDINIINNTIRTSGTTARGIFFNVVSNITAAFNNIQTTGSGIPIASSSTSATPGILNGTNITGNIIIPGSSTVGIQLYEISDASIEYNSINTTASAITIDQGSERINVTYNSITVSASSGYGISITASHNLIYYKNTIRTNLASSNGIQIASPSTRNNITDNDILVQGADSSAVYFASETTNIQNIVMDNNLLNSTYGNTIFLASSDTSQVTGLNATGNRIYTNATLDSGSVGVAAIFIQNNHSNNRFINNNFSINRNRYIIDESSSNYINYLIYNNSNGNIDFTGLRTNMTLISLNSSRSLRLTEEINITNNSISVNESYIFSSSGLSATLTFYGVDYSSNDNYNMLRNGAACASSICTKQSSSPATINVTQFSIYSTEGVYPAVSETTTSDKGGSGGGGSSKDPTSEEFISTLQTLGGIPSVINIDNGVIDSIRLITKINVKASIAAVLKDEPENIPEFSAKTYRYIITEAGKELINNLISATIFFSVNKNWLETNNIKEDQIIMLRYNNGWNELNTEKIGETENSVNYKAETDGFSTFVISIKELEEQEIPKKEETNEIIKEPIEAKKESIKLRLYNLIKKNNNLPIIILTIIIISIFSGLITLIYRIKSSY